MSDTPQTDNIPKFYFGDNRPSMEIECVSANFARSLERQRNELLYALEIMISDFGDYPASERPCRAFDLANSAITKAKEPLP